MGAAQYSQCSLDRILLGKWCRARERVTGLAAEELRQAAICGFTILSSVMFLLCVGGIRLPPPCVTSPAPSSLGAWI